MRMPQHCDRCMSRLSGFTMSRMNEDDICAACEDDERDTPNYAAAAAAELASVRRGERNFPGIGVAPDDWHALALHWLARAPDLGDGTLDAPAAFVPPPVLQRALQDLTPGRRRTLVQAALRANDARVRAWAIVTLVPGLAPDDAPNVPDTTGRLR